MNDLYGLHEILDIHFFKHCGTSSFKICECGYTAQHGRLIPVGSRFPHTDKFKTHIMNAVGRTGYRNMRKLYRFYDSGKKS